MRNPTFRISQIVLATAVGSACLLVVPAIGADSARVGTYDFGYVASGDARAKPVQVFDDGRHTFFQFRPGESIPAIFATKSGAPELLVPMQEGPYIKVTNLHGRFVLQVGRAQANVIHAGVVREDAPPLNVVSNTGLSSPYAGGPVPQGAQLVASLMPVGVSTTPDEAANRNSYATPRKGDAIKWVDVEPRQDEVSVMFARGSAVLSLEGRKAVAAAARASSRDSRLVVIGRDDETLKEGLDKRRAEVLSAALVKAGVDAARITSRVGVAGTARGTMWPSTILVETDRAMVVARPESTNRSTAVRSNLDALVAAGVLTGDQANAIAARHGTAGPAPAALVTQPVQDVAPKGGFALAASDKTVQGTLRRWATQMNYQLIWDAPTALDAPILGDAAIPGNSLNEALERLLAGLKEKGYALDATVFSNRVIRVTPAAASAARPAEPPTTPTPRVEPQAPVQQRGATTAGQWQMLQGDRNVRSMLARWAADARWILVWTAPDRIGITGDAVISSPSFKGAAEQVIAQASHAGYRLRMTTTDDRTLVVSSN